MLNDARAYDVGLSDDAGGGNPLCLASKVHAAPHRQDEVARVDEYIQYTLYGVKPDTASPPFKSLQVGGDPATGCQDPGGAPPHVDCDGIRMTMYYYARECDLHTYCAKYNCTLPPRNTSGYWPWNYTEVDKCSGLSPVHPWCMDERMANATCACSAAPHQGELLRATSAAAAAAVTSTSGAGGTGSADGAGGGSLPQTVRSTTHTRWRATGPCTTSRGTTTSWPRGAHGSGTWSGQRRPRCGSAAVGASSPRLIQFLAALCGAAQEWAGLLGRRGRAPRAATPAHPRSR